MTPENLRGVRLRLTAFYAIAWLIALGALVALAVKSRSDSEHQRLDRVVERQAIDAGGWSYEYGGTNKLRIDRSEDGPFAPKPHTEVPVVVVSPAGAVQAGPPDTVDPAAGRRAYTRAARARKHILYTDVVHGAESRVGATPSIGTTRVMAAVVAVQALSKADDEVRSYAIAVGAAALGLWVLTIGVGWVLTGRALAPAVTVARREQAFLADAAHELRTPVAVIRARAEQGVHESEPDTAEHDALRAISRAAEQASSTIADMLELARLDARRGRVEREPLRLDALVEQIVEEFSDDAARTGVEIRTSLDGQLVVLGDERLLGRAVANLVQNAIRYGGVGGEIRVSVARDGGFGRVDVADRGPGVPPAQRGAIFDRFHRASSAAGGSGLGLPIARLVAESHDGTLELIPPAEGETGAHFALRVPLDAPESS